MTDGRPSRSASLGSLATVPGTRQTVPPSQATPQADYDLDEEVPHGAAGPILGAFHVSNRTGYRLHLHGRANAACLLPYRDQQASH